MRCVLLFMAIAVSGMAPPPATCARQVAHRVLLRCLGKNTNAFADRVLDAELAKATALAPGDIGMATELTYGVMRTASSIDYLLQQLTSPAFLSKSKPRTVNALRIGAYEVLHLKTPDYAAVDEAVSLVGRDKSQRSFTNGVLRNLIRRRDKDKLPQPRLDTKLSSLQALAIETSTPLWLLKALSSSSDSELNRKSADAPSQSRPPLLDMDDLASWARASQQQPALALRVNLNRVTRDEVLKELQIADLEATPVADVDSAILLTAGGGRVSSLPGFAEGHWSVQDVGAQLVALLAAPDLGATVIDLCGAPGGKSTHLSELVGAGGTVISVELHPRKARLIHQSSKRLGLEQILQVAVGDAKDEGVLASLLAEHGCGKGGADVVVLDAPCSGLGTLRRNPEHRYKEADPEGHAILAELQAKLLDAAATCVRIGGTLTYSVCSPIYTETEGRVLDFLQRSVDRFEVVPASEVEALGSFVSDSVALGKGSCVRTWTHLHPADSHFAVKLRRKS